MTDAERWRLAKALFHDALDRPPADRAGYLRRAASDDALREEVDALLAAHDAAEAEGTLDEPLVFDTAMLDRGPDAPPDGADPLLGARVGAWRLDERVGEGGMGAVYRAARAGGHFEQQAAVKVLHAGPHARRLADRLAQERALLARLDHPGIARLLDGGLAEGGALGGLPWLALAFVHGRPLTAYADEHGLGVDDRLRLFLQVCDAVAYAHARLVVHRDLKPTNVLVGTDDVGRPRATVLDFGIAKILSGDEDALLTQTGESALTPAYAAPEQLRGDAVTTATDVYALGVLLYELLAGRRPYELTGKTAAEAERLVTAHEPALMSRADGVPPERAGRLRGDLDLIVQRAMAKEPERRYPTADALAADLRRHLDGFPVEARPPTAAYRARTFARRHRAGVAAAAVAVLALVAGLGVALWQAAEARAERDRAEQRFAETRALTNTLLFDVHDDVRDLPGSTPARERIVREALAYLDRLAADPAADRSLQLELAEAYERVGQIQFSGNSPSLGDTDGAVTSYRRALAIRQAVLDAAPGDAEARRGLASGHRAFHTALAFSGASEEALREIGEADTLLQALVAERPDDPALAAEAGAVAADLGWRLHTANAHEAAVGAFRRGLALFRPALTEESVPFATRLDHAHALGQFGEVFHWNNETDSALAYIGASMERFDRLAREQPDSDAAQQGRWLQRVTRSRIYDPEDAASLPPALDAVREGVAIARTNAARTRQERQWRRNLAQSRLRYAETLGDAGEAAASSAQADTFVTLQRTLVAEDPGNAEERRAMGHALLLSGNGRRDTGRLAPAVERYAEAIALFQTLRAADPERSAYALDEANAQAQLGLARDAQAERARGAERRRRWAEARDAHTASADLLQRLRDAEKLPAFFDGIIAEERAAAQQAAAASR